MSDPFSRLDAIVSQYSASFSSIKARSSSSTSSTSAFVHAVANAPSTDFIRAANPAQASVYAINVNHLNANKAGELEVKEVRRKTVAVATPLKKAGGSKPRKSRTGSTTLDDDNDPEVPLRAALKLIDMYPESADHKLRDKIMEMIEEDRDQAERIRAYLRPKQKAPLTQDEQTRIRQLEDEVRQLEEENARLRFKVDTKIRAETARQFELAEASIDGEDSPIAIHRRIKPSTRNNNPEEEEDDETINFQKLGLVDNSLLMEADTPNISQLIAQTPMKLDSLGHWDRNKIQFGAGGVRSQSGLRTPSPREDESVDDSQVVDPDEDESYVEEDTIGHDAVQEDVSEMMDAPSPLAEKKRLSSPLDSPEVSRAEIAAVPQPLPPCSPSPIASKTEVETTGTMSFEDMSKMRGYTTKIWSIAGDVLVPNNRYEASKGPGTQPTPDFKQTRTILQSIVDEPSPSNAPAPEVHRVLTAVLLLFLTERDSSTVDTEADAFSATMMEVRELLDSVIADRGWRKENKVIFTWVGKKLLKSDGGRRLRCNLD